jgi:hypothetical protein
MSCRRYEEAVIIFIAMRNSLHAKTVVLTGGRIQFEVPELAEGLEVDVIVVPSNKQPQTVGANGIGDFLRSLPPVDRTQAEWLGRDREFEKDRSEWDR